eukprot:2950790-Pyramimonas_sp.AAC.1
MVRRWHTSAYRRANLQPRNANDPANACERERGRSIRRERSWLDRTETRYTELEGLRVVPSARLPTFL